MKPLLRTAALGVALGLGVGALAAKTKAATLASPGPTAILAAQAPENSSQTETIFEIINFALLLAVLVYFLRKPARDFFAQRTAATRQKLEEGAKALEAAGARLAEVEGKLAGLEQEIAQFKTDAEKGMEAEIQRIKHETSEELARIQQFGQSQMAGAIRAAKGELKRFAAHEAIEQARAGITGRLDDNGRRRLVGFFLAGVRQQANKN